MQNVVDLNRLCLKAAKYEIQKPSTCRATLFRCKFLSILTLLLVFHQIHNLSRNKFARALANQPISAPHFFNLQQMFLLRVKLITQGEKRETSTKTCNETMLRDKLKVFVSCISPPLRNDYLTIRPVARKGYGSIAHEAKPNGLLTRGP